jgi:hypothetical protein
MDTIKKISFAEGKTQVKLIRSTWKKIAYCFEGISYGQYGNNYLRENIQEEKLHDSGRFESVKRFLSIQEAGELFAVKQLVKYLIKDEVLTVEGYHYMRKSIFTAYSLAHEYKEKLLKALEGVNVSEVLAVNYAELQRIPEGE